MILGLGDGMKLKNLYCKARRLGRKLGHPYCAAVIVAAGTASRMGGTDKILTLLQDRPVLAYSLETFNRCELVDEIVIVTRQDLLEPVSTVCAEFAKAKIVVPGGETRTDSVMAGLDAVTPGTELVAVHDGARPLVSAEIVAQTLAKAAKFGAATPAVPVKDTIKVSRKGVIDHTPDRRALFAVQTPQCFDFDLLRGALQNAAEKKLALTDDCSAVEALGMQIQLTQGAEENLKLTTPLDLQLAELILQRRTKPCE